MKNQNNPTLIIDCDGVLYPKEDLQLHEFVDAMKIVAKEFNISDERFEQISKETKEKNPGIFNFIYALCNKDETKHQEFVKQMAEETDYSRIKRDDNLFKLLKKTQNNFDVVIFTNNTRPHLENVFAKRFGRKIDEMGIDCYDISHTKCGEVFHPKQSLLGLKIFSKKIGKHPSECVLVDDTPRNIEAAENIGMQGVLITPEFTLHKYLNSLSNKKDICLNKGNGRY